MTGVLELLPKDNTHFWLCHQFIAGWRGLPHARWANPDPAKFRQDSQGDYAEVDARAVARQARAMLETVRQRKQQQQQGKTG